MAQELEYAYLTDSERIAIIQDRIKAVETDHFIASINLNEISGTDHLDNGESLLRTRQQLIVKMEHAVVRIRNLKELLN